MHHFLHLRMAFLFETKWSLKIVAAFRVDVRPIRPYANLAMARNTSGHLHKSDFAGHFKIFCNPQFLKNLRLPEQVLNTFAYYLKFHSKAINGSMGPNPSPLGYGSGHRRKFF